MNVCVTPNINRGLGITREIKQIQKYVRKHYPILVEQKSSQAIKTIFVEAISFLVSFSFH